jgi:hypothetical protein
MLIGAGTTAGRVAAATPAERDRFADLLRVAGILVVVAGHWPMAVAVWAVGGTALGLADPTPGIPSGGPAPSLGPGLRGHAAPLVALFRRFEAAGAR